MAICQRRDRQPGVLRLLSIWNDCCSLMHKNIHNSGISTLKNPVLGLWLSRIHISHCILLLSCLHILSCGQRNLAMTLNWTTQVPVNVNTLVTQAVAGSWCGKNSLKKYQKGINIQAP